MAHKGEHMSFIAELAFEVVGETLLTGIAHLFRGQRTVRTLLFIALTLVVIGSAVGLWALISNS